MKLPRSASSFDSQEEFDDYWSDRENEYDDEAQKADDVWSEREEK